MPSETFWSVLLQFSYYKGHDYIWFRDGDLNGFRDITPFTKRMGWDFKGMHQIASWSVYLNDLIIMKIIYMVWGRRSERSSL